MTEMDPATSSLCSRTQWLACLPQLHTRWFAHAQLHRQLIVCFNLTTTFIVHRSTQSCVDLRNNQGWKTSGYFLKNIKSIIHFGRKYQIHISDTYRRYRSCQLWEQLVSMWELRNAHICVLISVHSCHYIIIILRLVIHTVTATQSVRESS